MSTFNSIQNPVRHSELFRFVKVRNPEIQKRTGHSNQTKKASPIYFNPGSGYGDSVYSSLKDLKNQNANVTAYLEFENNYKTSAQYIKSREDAAALINIDLILEIEDKDFTFIQEVKEYIEAQTNLNLEELFVELYNKSWDNLFIQGLSIKPNYSLVNSVTSIIYILELYSRIKTPQETDQWDKKIIENLKKSFIVIPTEIVPNNILNDLATNTPTKSDTVAENTDAENRIIITDKIDRLKDTKSAIISWYNFINNSIAKNNIKTPPFSETLPYRITEEQTTENETASIKRISDADIEKSQKQFILDNKENDLFKLNNELFIINRNSIEKIAQFSNKKSETKEELEILLSLHDEAASPDYLINELDEQLAYQKSQLSLLPSKKSLRTVVVGKSIFTEELPSSTPQKRTAESREASKEGSEICKIKTLGTGDLLRVEQKLICYRPGEIAHIENILAGEEKSRSTRRLKRTEETFTEEIEKITEEEKDLQTTDRYEMESESEKTISQNYSLETGLNVSGSYGVVDFEASLGFSMNLSTTESNRNSTKFAKEVVEKTRRKVSERIKTTKSIMIIEEFEENNGHKITNSTPDHKVGIYRWIDKYYKARLVNYGRRAFIEFTIPEPAAYHIYNKSEASNPDLYLEKPIHPTQLVRAEHGMDPISSHLQINQSNYDLLCAFYDAPAIQLVPNLVLTTETLSIPDKGMNKFDAMYYVASKDIVIPVGYSAIQIDINVNHGNYIQSYPTLLSWWKDKTGDDKLEIDYEPGKGFMVQVANNKKDSTGVTPYGLFPHSFDSNNNVVTGGVTSKLSFTAKAVIPVLVTANVHCKRNSSTYEKWQQDCYQAIITAYNKKNADYEEALKQLKDDLVYISGSNPDINRKTENRELKRGCIEQLLNVRKANNWYCFKYWTEYGAIKEGPLCTGVNDKGETYTKDKYPFIQFCDAINQGKEVMFFEQAIEWRHMNYIYYPYFWARKCQWRMLYNIEDNDPLFTNFLKSGMARVVLPIRSGFEASVMNYLETGLVWDGQQTPLIGDPLFVDISTEIAEALDYDLGVIDDNDPRVISKWEFKLPTNLVLLQNYAQPVDENGLPCTQTPTIE